MINTTYKEMLDTCIEKKVFNMKALSRLFDWSGGDLEENLSHVIPDFSYFFFDVKRNHLQQQYSKSKGSIILEEGEVLKPIFHIQEGLYVSNYGRLAKEQSKKLGSNGEYGYGVRLIEKASLDTHIVIKEKGKRVSYYLMDIIAELFLPNPNNYKHVINVGYNSYDNHVMNLRWVKELNGGKHQPYNYFKIGQ